MPDPKRPLKVFLCHAHADRDAVRTLYTRLTNDGVDAWLDKEKLLPGQDWELEIRKAVREADVVVVCLSKQFNQAGFRQKEVRLALDTAMEKPEGEIFIIPTRLEECDTLESLRKWHWADLFDVSGYAMLMRALRSRADRTGATIDNGVEINIVEEGQVVEKRYRIQKILSITNHSQVVQAWDETLRRKVAIKFLYLPEQDDRAFTGLRNHVTRTIIQLAKLHHPNLEVVHNLIDNPVGVVSEWIDGKSIQYYFNENRVFEKVEAVRIGMSLADTLDYVHSNGIIHRDIKPSNIILSISNEPILVDFDIAYINSRETIAYAKERDFSFVGTIRYSAPEQMITPERVNSSADIFSLGIVIYELLTRETPYTFGNYPNAYVHNMLPLPGKSNIPDGLYKILCQVLSQDPEMRPSASLLRNELKLIYQQLLIENH